MNSAFFGRCNTALWSAAIWAALAPQSGQADAQPAGSPTFDPACLVVTTTDDGGNGSLRQAIECANAHAGLDTITFAIPGNDLHRIRVFNPLPTITDSVIIDGYTQSGASPNTIATDGNNAQIRIVLDGAEGGFAPGTTSAVRPQGEGPGSVDNLVVNADGCTIRGLSIVRFEGAGIVLRSQGNWIVGNYLGVLPNPNDSFGNDGPGVEIRTGGNNWIGGTEPAEANVIAYNGAAGVSVGTDGPSSGNRIVGNSIHHNQALGIDLGGDGVTPNDAGDTDSGSNGLQNFPRITRAQLTDGGLFVEGTIDSPLPQRIEIFDNDACDASGNGEGQRFLGYVEVPGGTGTRTFSKSFPGDFEETTRLSATATSVVEPKSSRAGGTARPAGKSPDSPLLNTSEFGPCVPVTAVLPVITLDDKSVREGDAGISRELLIVKVSAPAPSGGLTFQYRLVSQTAQLGSDFLGEPTGTVFIPEGSTIAPLALQIAGDTVYEGNETLAIELSASPGTTLPATFARTSVLVTIEDDDPAPPITVENLSTNGVALNRQTGLFEQHVRVRNTGAGPSPGARVLLGGLAAGVVVRNASGTEGGTPYIDIRRTLAASEAVELIVEYYVANRLPPALPTLTIVSNSTTTPPASTNSIAFAFARQINGRFLLEFSAETNRTYTIEYANLSSASGTNTWKRAVPDLTAQSSAVFWYDDGPPKTETFPTNRIYRVRLSAPATSSTNP